MAGAAQRTGQDRAVRVRLEISNEPVCYPVRRAIYAGAWITCCSTASPTKMRTGSTESFFNSLKNERVHATRYRTHQDAKADLFEYIEVFYNRSRRHSSLGLVSPEQFLRDWIKAQQTKDAAA
ncbi:IS3 family transposase [Burkholderia cenocepacia]|uniref:IS3 family transposase n=1 Tax=Burkholderia cenocepacia TaxID=95486 RepID=UPI0035A28A0B